MNDDSITGHRVGGVDIEAAAPACDRKERHRQRWLHESEPSAFASRSTPLRMLSIDVAYESRTKPGAPNPEPGTTATLPTSTNQSHSCTSSSRIEPSGLFFPTYTETSGNA